LTVIFLKDIILKFIFSKIIEIMGFDAIDCRWRSPAFLNFIRYYSLSVLFGLVFCYVLLIQSFGAQNDLNSQVKDLNELINNTLVELQEELAPDPRLDLFEVDWEIVDGLLKLTGWVTDGDISDKIYYRFHVELGFDIHQESRLRHFPDPIVFGHHWGIINVSLANVSIKPHPVVKSSHRVNQLIMGTVVKIIRYHESGFAQIQGPDDYLGWVNKNDMLRINDGRKINWEKSVSHIIGIPVFKSGNTKLYFGTRVILRQEKPPNKALIELPNGKGLIVDRDVLLSLNKAGSALPPGKKSICRLARKFLDTSYMWGGVSSDGIDCSGLVQLVYWWHGIQIPRDCSQQIRIAEHVEKLEDLQPGDMMVFADPGTKKIVHCAIVLEDKEFIHSEGGRGVVIDSYDPQAANFNAGLMRKYLKAGRFLAEKMYIY